MSSVVAPSTTMRAYPLSHVESPELKATRTSGVERCVTGFPVGFGGWTAAKMYERSNQQQHTAHQMDNTAASDRQEVGINHKGSFTPDMRCRAAKVRHHAQSPIALQYSNVRCCQISTCGLGVKLEFHGTIICVWHPRDILARILADTPDLLRTSCRGCPQQ